MRKSLPLIAASLVLLLAYSSRAAVVYFNGFETGDPGTADFSGAPIASVASGGGALHLTAATGSNYAEINNIDDDYQTGYGDSVYTRYGAPAGIPISGPFYESIKVYINTAWAAAGPDNNNQGFWIDTTPNTDPGYLDESNFRIADTGDGTIQVLGTAGNPGAASSGAFATIAASGWYTFRTTFEDDGGVVKNTLTVLDALGNVIGTFSGDSTLPFASLTGTNYADWFTVWENGFAGDVLGIDDVEVGTLASTATPEPASLAVWSVLAVVTGGSYCWRRSRKTSLAA
jgi:hypothetical protein